MKRTGLLMGLHILIIIAMLSLMAIGCEKKTEDVSTAPSPQETKTPAPATEPSPTVSPSPTPTASPTLDSDYPDEAPKLPPSFGLDTDVFSSLPDTLPSSEPIAQGAILASISLPGKDTISSQAAWGDQSHWNHASGNVLVWSAIIVTGLAIPVAAFVAAFDNTPYREDANTWIWSYDVNIAGKKHTAELHGSYIADGVEWEMYISKEGEFEKFKWYYGESDMAGTEGFWLIKENPSTPNDLLRIDWERDPVEGTNEIKYENIKPGAPEKGGYIVTSVTNDTPYDSYWDIYNKGKDNHTYIEWNRTTEEGRVKDAIRFGGNEWHCWDANHQNIDCP